MYKSGDPKLSIKSVEIISFTWRNHETNCNVFMTASSKIFEIFETYSSKTLITSKGYWLQFELARSVFDLVLNACLQILQYHETNCKFSMKLSSKIFEIFETYSSKTLITSKGYWLQFKLARSVFDLVLNACLQILQYHETNWNFSMKASSKIFEIFETYPAKHLLHPRDIDFHLSWRELSVFDLVFRCVSANITIPFD